MSRRGFTLIEMLVATVVAAVLTAGVLLVVSGMSRDRALLASTETTASPERIVEVLRRDIANAQAMASSRMGDSLLLIGNGGIDPVTLAGDGRMVRVTYRVVRSGTQSQLLREQRYLDDRTNPRPWRDLVARDVESLIVTSAGRELPVASDVIDGESLRNVPSKVLLRVKRSRETIDEELWVR